MLRMLRPDDQVVFALDKYGWMGVGGRTEVLMDTWAGNGQGSVTKAKSRRNFTREGSAYVRSADIRVPLLLGVL